MGFAVHLPLGTKPLFLSGLKALLKALLDKM